MTSQSSVSSPALLMLIFSTVVSLTAINQLSSSLRLCLWTRTAIMSLKDGMAEVLSGALYPFSSLLTPKMFLQHHWSLDLPEDETKDILCFLAL